MSYQTKRSKRGLKRSALNSSIDIEETNHNVLEKPANWFDIYEFLSPHELFDNSIGLIFNLTTKYLVPSSFTNLYSKSLKMTWLDYLIRERLHLKSNIHSVEKCFMINRLIAEYKKDPCQFARQTGQLYEDIKQRISLIFPSDWTINDLYHQIKLWKTLQIQRRLFHISHVEANQVHSLPSLQHFATNIYSDLLASYQRSSNRETYNNLRQLLQHCFIVVIQPSISECVAATKYEKYGDIYSAKLTSRILFLLDPIVFEQNLELSDVGVTLLPFDPMVHLCGERQQALRWRKKQILNAERILRSFYYVELQSIELKILDPSSSRPSYNSKICQIQFEIKIRINELNIEENVTIHSQPFGICSHGQYYPEYVAKILLYEVAQISLSDNHLIEPDILTQYMNRYYTKISGVEAKPHTTQYIKSVLQTAYDRGLTNRNITNFDPYQDIIAKLISQMESFTHYPFLSMMYHDELFLGICDPARDQQLFGTRQEPSMLLRFNALSEHQSTQHASIRFIVHNGELTRATFHPKAFVDEMCQMICKANKCLTMNMNFKLNLTDRKFHEFNSYFDDELLRLNTAATHFNDSYQPIMPVICDIIRISFAERSKHHEPPLDVADPFAYEPLWATGELYQSSASTTQDMAVDLSNMHLVTTNPITSSQQSAMPRNISGQQYEEDMSDILMNPQFDNASHNSNQIKELHAFLSTLTHGNVEQQKFLLLQVLRDYSHIESHHETAAQTSTSVSDMPSDDLFYDG